MTTTPERRITTMIQDINKRFGLDNDLGTGYSFQVDDDAAPITMDPDHLTIRDILHLICEGFNLR